MMNYKLLTIPLMLLCAACGKEKKASELNETSVETVLPSETNEVTAIPLVRSEFHHELISNGKICLLYTSPSPRDRQKSRMPSSA